MASWTAIAPRAAWTCCRGARGALLPDTFRLDDNDALMGRHAAARRVFENLPAIHDLGLPAEEYDSTARRQLGNFPQAFSHLGLINTARILPPREEPAEVRQTAWGDRG